MHQLFTDSLRAVSVLAAIVGGSRGKSIIPNGSVRCPNRR
jgi:hypothetical protein